MFRIYPSLHNALVLLFFLVFLAGCSGVGTSIADLTPTASVSTPTAETPTPAVTPTPTLTPTPSPFQVASVEMSVHPDNINGLPCGTVLTVNYTATFHLLPQGPGGKIDFEYTSNNGKKTDKASVTVEPRAETATYTFSWNGQLTADNVNPGQGGVIVNSPNKLTSSLVKPNGTCVPSPVITPTSFAVESIDLAVTPTLAGQKCGNQFTATYTATFHFKPAGPGGDITFTYTTDNGKSNSQPVKLHINPGEIIKTYTFTWSGKLPADHTQPGIGIVHVSSPNSLLSPTAKPAGACN